MVAAILNRYANRPAVIARLAIAGAALVFLSAPSMSSMLMREGIEQVPLSQDRFQHRELVRFTVQEDALLNETGKSAQQRNSAIPLAPMLADKVAPFRSIAPGSSSYGTAVNCMTEAIYYEAANESEAGKRAVAQVILNRVSHPDYPSSVCGVVYQGWSDAVCQFSYTCDGSLSRRPVARLWEQSRSVARAALAGHVEGSVGTATHYHADYVLPYWAYRLEKVHVEGRHIFYRFPGRAGRAASFTARWLGREYKPQYDPTRFAAAREEEMLAAPETPAQRLARDPTDRRADNDVGGRLDTSTGWTLAIPDPTTASSGYLAAQEGQQGAGAVDNSSRRDER